MTEAAENWIDIGDDHQMQIRSFEGDPMSSVSVRHKRPDGSQCEHYAPIKGGAWERHFSGQIEAWDLHQRDPLTISPSLLCRICGDHGFIRNGKWVKS